MTAPPLTIIQDWPAQMRKETAIAYVDAKSVRVFDKAVAAGLYPRPYNKPGEGERWLRTELDAAIQPKTAANDEDEFA